MQNNIDLLRNFWYVAAPSAGLSCGGKLPVTLLGEPILLLRDKTGAISAIRDFCPHRGIPLRHGRFNGCEIECCYHGWRFDMRGHCTAIPSLLDDKVEIEKIKTGSYPCHEKDGIIWLYAGQAEGKPDAPPSFPIAMPRGLTHVTSVTFPCPVDHAIIGLMDPAHGSFVHRSWWWRSARSIHEKSKHFAPRPFGFAMVNHKPSANSRAYRILGGERRTEIQFQLPGLRSEHITIGRRHVFLLTALTPVDTGSTRLHQFVYTSVPLLRFLTPLFAIFGRAFIAQDLDIVIKQQEGIGRADHPPLMLMGDGDAQALWYYRLKKEALNAASEQRGFVNPLRERTLRWRS